MTEVKRRTRTALDADLCDHWVLYADHRCGNYAVVIIKLEEPTEVGGKTMFGTYPPGEWQFCRMHGRIFERDRK